jgi:hypothetical protein
LKEACGERKIPDGPGVESLDLSGVPAR